MTHALPYQKVCIEFSFMFMHFIRIDIIQQVSDSNAHSAMTIKGTINLYFIASSIFSAESYLLYIANKSFVKLALMELASVQATSGGS